MPANLGEGAMEGGWALLDMVAPERDLGDFEAGDKAHQIVSMCANITHHQRWPTLDRVVAPGQPASRWVGVVFIGLATLDIFHLHQADCTYLTIHDHRFGLAHHGVACVIVRQAEYQTGVLYLLV